MAMRLPTSAVNAACNAVVDLIDADAATGSLQLRTGSQPASANNAATGTLLAEFTLPFPAFGNAVAGVATLLGVPISTTGLAAGTAGWFRVLDDSGDTVFDGAAATSGSEFNLNTLTVSIGSTITITSGTVTMPPG